jgi:hypothetical protein
MTTRRSLVIPVITLVIAAALLGTAGTAMAAGGDFSLDFVAAGPFTYNHETGVGGEFADRTISKTEGVVESLEGGDFACGDKVVYLTEITVDGGASGEQDIELDFSFLAEPTGQPGVGHSDLLSATPNSDDSGMSGDTDDTTVSILSENIDTTPPPAKDTLFATVAIDNLDAGEVFILRLVTLLECLPDPSPTGNLQATIESARVVEPESDSINVGRQTIPFKVQGVQEEEPPADEEEPVTVIIDVGECPGAGSPTTPVTITIDPPGSATVDITGPGGPYFVDGDGAVLDLPPGDYHSDSDPVDGFFMEDDSSDFSVEPCPEVLASVVVSLNACPATSSTTQPATVTINPEGAAQVAIHGTNGLIEVVSGSGATLHLAPGAYSWAVEESPGFELIGAFEGVLHAGSCVVEVLPDTELPKTGANLPGLAGIGFGFLFLGFGMIRLSRRPSLELAVPNRTAIVLRLSGRSDWASFFAAGSWLGTVRVRVKRGASRWAGRTRRSREGRASRHR